HVDGQRGADLGARCEDVREGAAQRLERGLAVSVNDRRRGGHQTGVLSACATSAMSTSAPPDRIDASRAALIVYDACRRALAPADPARRAAMRPVLDAWVTLIGGCRAHGLPIIYTTPGSRAARADLVLLPTDLSVQTGAPSLTNRIE